MDTTAGDKARDVQSPLLTTPEAAQYLRLAEVTLETDRCTRRLGIPFRKLGRCVRYHRADLDAWLQKRMVIA